MRVFLAEFTCGGGFEELPLTEIPPNFLSEGGAMLGNLAEDAARCCEVITALDSRFAGRFSNLAADQVTLLPGSYLDQWIDIATRCDAAILIAPESENLLIDICTRFRENKINLIACDCEFLRAATDKITLAQHLEKAKVPCPEAANVQELADGWIVKPRDGCGSDNIQFCESLDQAECLFAESEPELMIQPRICGQATSIAGIAEFETITWLPATEQLLNENTFAYRGGRAPLSPNLQSRAQRLASDAIKAMPGVPRGYIGVDLLLGADASQDVVIEVNPRLTTSYIGSRRLLTTNLVAKMLELDNQPLQLSPEVRQVSWTAEGEVTVE